MRDAVGVIAMLGFLLFGDGCGGPAGSMTPLPITVSLAISTVTVAQGGPAVFVLLQITSTSETAAVAVTGLPVGLKETYAASDTNPSGQLAFTASTQTPVGTYQPTITVNSAGQTAATTFTLVVTSAVKAGENGDTLKGKGFGPPQLSEGQSR